MKIAETTVPVQKNGVTRISSWRHDGPTHCIWISTSSPQVHPFFLNRLIAVCKRTWTPLMEPRLNLWQVVSRSYESYESRRPNTKNKTPFWVNAWTTWKQWLKNSRTKERGQMRILMPSSRFFRTFEAFWCEVSPTHGCWNPTRRRRRKQLTSFWKNCASYPRIPLLILRLCEVSGR